MKKTPYVLAFAGLLASCGSVNEPRERAVVGPDGPEVVADEDAEDEGDSEEAVALDQVPAALKDAAVAAVPGLVLESAEKETERGSTHYCLHGYAAGEFVEVEVGLDGAVLEIERGEDDEDD